MTRDQTHYQNRLFVLNRGKIHPHRRLRRLVAEVKSLPVWVRQCLILIIWSRVITYTSAWLYMLFPKWSNKIVDPFLFAHQPMPICWLIKYSTDDVSWLIISYTMCKMSAMLSNFLFLVCVIVFGWQIIDAIMLWVNYKHGHLFYIDMIWVTLALIYSALKGYRPETLARVKSIF
jgi:hypothetical protein